MFLWTLLAALVLLDPERILHRAMRTNEETIQWLTSYFNSQLTTPEHDNLVKLLRDLENVREELRKLIE